MKVVWLTAALKDRVETFNYIERTSRDNAELVDDRLLEIVGLLGQFPAVGRLGRDGLREFVIVDTGHIILYKVHRTHISIARVLRGTRKR